MAINCHLLRTGLVSREPEPERTELITVRASAINHGNEYSFFSFYESRCLHSRDLIPATKSLGCADMKFHRGRTSQLRPRASRERRARWGTSHPQKHITVRICDFRATQFFQLTDGRLASLLTPQHCNFMHVLHPHSTHAEHVFLRFSDSLGQLQIQIVEPVNGPLVLNWLQGTASKHSLWCCPLLHFSY